MRSTSNRRLTVALCAFTWLPLPPVAAAEPRFEGYEIRVIRPRYFTKTNHLELSGGLGAIVNQTFVYSFLATGILSWHFNETLALEAQVGYGVNLDRGDKTRLADAFGISTIVLRTESMANARLVWTPSYGKFHLTKSRILYFETHLAAGGGMTGVRYLYDHCEKPAEVPEDTRDRVPEPPGERLVQYPTIVIGAGQRYFLDQSSSLRLGIDLQRFFADRNDGACDGGRSEAREAAANDNLFLHVSWSYYL